VEREVEQVERSGVMPSNRGGDIGLFLGMLDNGMKLGILYPSSR
jgi:hypothetical protein